MLSVAIRPSRFSYHLVNAAREFVVNIPRADQVAEVDFAGVCSGADHDKFAELGFTAQPSAHVSAPLIAECPINIECRVAQTLVRPIHTVFLGEVVAVHASEGFLREGVPDVARIEPIFYAPDPSQGKHVHSYWTLGERIGRAFEIGKGLKKG